MSNYLSDREAKELICEIGRRVFAKGLVAANDGNITLRTGENEIWATPTGVSKGYMTPDMLVKMDFEGNVLEGMWKPSSEVKMHLRVYKENPSVGGTVHAHPPVATSYAITGEWMDQPIFAESIIQLGVVPVAEYATPGTQEVPDSVAPFCKDYNCCLLAAHGALTWGADLMQAYYRMEALEHFAKIHTAVIGHRKPAQMLTEKQVDRLLEIRASCNNGSPAGGIPANRGTMQYE
ncbi:3-oxo-tetronate 4-phosphate decarboxylase [Lachnospiraceae bacterium]|jgi:L-fuculose-phosphate aldolase|nr:3-oxo-tetronate 4-phosphate decarboxylase [Lachnospiraceae bacterium]